MKITPESKPPARRHSDIVTCPVAVICYPDNSCLREKGPILPHSQRLTVMTHHSGKSQQWELEAASHTASPVQSKECLHSSPSQSRISAQGMLPPTVGSLPSPIDQDKPHRHSPKPVPLPTLHLIQLTFEINYYTILHSSLQSTD